MWSPPPDLDQAACGAGPLGLYLHVPFCRRKCSYCSFASGEDPGLMGAWATRLARDLRAGGAFLGRPRVDTLYLGGGTPSLLPEEILRDITLAVRTAFDLDHLEEATLEANPGTLTSAWLQEARALGWNRLSLGVQSLDPGLLAALGRSHTAREALEGLEAATRAGFQRLSADLMLGIPGQALDRVEADARTLVAQGAGHLSVYMLDLDKDSPLAREVARGGTELPPEEAVADAYEALHATLPALGLSCYEISNFARPGQASRHNLRYWQRRPYLGLGPSAASQLAHLRWTEEPRLEAWLAGRGPGPVEVLSPAEVLGERALLGLRMAEGIPWRAYQAEARTLDLEDLWLRWEAELAPYRRAGLLEEEQGRLRLTVRGMLLSSQVLQVFV